MTTARARTLTLVATSLGLAVVQLDVSVFNIAIKPIGASLGGGVSALQWVVSAYALAFAALILSGGFALFTAALSSSSTPRSARWVSCSPCAGPGRPLAPPGARWMSGARSP
jgi:hypothetical protein